MDAVWRRSRWLRLLASVANLVFGVDWEKVMSRSPAVTWVLLVVSLVLVADMLWAAMRYLYRRASRALVGTTGRAVGTEASAETPDRTPGSDRLKGTASFDYSQHNGRFYIGESDHKFVTMWGKAGVDTVHTYSDASSIKRLAVCRGVGRFHRVPRNEKALDYTSRAQTVAEGEIVVLQNIFSFYAAVKVVSIEGTKLTISYVINEFGSTVFIR